MSKKRLLVLLGILALFVFGCSNLGNTSRGIRQATLRDTIFSVEKENNGLYQIWFTHDDVAVYCTVDDVLGTKALSLLHEHNGEVVADYRDLKDDDPEVNTKDGNIACGQGLTVTMKVKLLTLIPVPGRSGNVPDATTGLVPSATPVVGR